MSRPGSRRVPSARSWEMAAGLVLALATGCSGGSKATTARKRPPPLVAVAKVQERDVPVEARGPVDLRPLAQADLSSKVLGILDAVLVDRGDKVTRGQIVALVRPSDTPFLLGAAQQNLASAKASTALARSNASRAQALAPGGVISQQELQQATANLQAAEAAELAAQQQIEGVAVRLGETRILSPLDGLVWQRRLDPGALVGQPSGGVILSVVQVNVLRMLLDVNERQATSIRVGQEAFIELDALPGRRVGGKVVRVSPVFDPTTRTLQADVHIPNPDGELRPGMYGRGSIVLDVHPGMPVVPASAVQISSNAKYVYVLDGDRVQRRAIETGVDGGNWLEVTRGLRPGEEVVTAGMDGLADGAQVRPVRGVDPFSGQKLAEDKAPDGLAKEKL
jgi:RND family efflux transporter MFP subunit